MKRSIWFWLYFIVSIILATYLAVRVAMTLMGHGPTAKIHTISISSDVRGTDLTPVSAAAAVPAGTHSYSIDLDAICGRIAATPGVKTASIRRMPNGNLRVRVQMYTAVAQWTDGGAFYPLSADGTIVRRPSETRDAASVLFRGDVPDDISEITKAAHNMIDRLDYLEWIEHRRWNLHTTGGITVMLPEDNATGAIASLIMLDDKYGLLSRDISVIDMRDDTRTLIK